MTARRFPLSRRFKACFLFTSAFAIFLAGAVISSAQSNNVAFYFGSLSGGFPALVRSVSVAPAAGSVVVGGVWYPGDSKTFNVANYPALTNGVVIFTNQHLGINFAVTVATPYSVSTTNYFIPSGTLPDTVNGITAMNWAGTGLNGVFYYNNLITSVSSPYSFITATTGPIQDSYVTNIYYTITNQIGVQVYDAGAGFFVGENIKFTNWIGGNYWLTHAGTNYTQLAEQDYLGYSQTALYSANVYFTNSTTLGLVQSNSTPVIFPEANFFLADTNVMYVHHSTVSGYFGAILGINAQPPSLEFSGTGLTLVNDVRGNSIFQADQNQDIVNLGYSPLGSINITTNNVTINSNLVIATGSIIIGNGAGLTNIALNTISNNFQNALTVLGNTNTYVQVVIQNLNTNGASETGWYLNQPGSTSDVQNYFGFYYNSANYTNFNAGGYANDVGYIYTPIGSSPGWVRNYIFNTNSGEQWFIATAATPTNLVATLTTNGFQLPAGEQFFGNGGGLTNTTTLLATNYNASNFIPVPGVVKIVCSNNWLFTVTPWKTNALLQIQ